MYMHRLVCSVLAYHCVHPYFENCKSCTGFGHMPNAVVLLGGDDEKNLLIEIFPLPLHTGRKGKHVCICVSCVS